MSDVPLSPSALDKLMDVSSEELKKKNQKWCKHHSQHVDNMKYAAAKASDDGAQKEKIANALKDDQKLGLPMGDFKL
ncbi:unnamed protein product [Symbiodinium sp. KB8]|nr:unnamed protein product [Symbiodinium sp. KB8]